MSRRTRLGIPVVTAMALVAAMAPALSAASPAHADTSEAPAQRAVDGDPTITLSQTTFADEGSVEITVIGENFDPTKGIGTRPPLSGQPAGAYVVFGAFADVWKPSEGAPSSARRNSSQQWATPGGNFGVTIDENGDFTTTLTIDKAAADAVAEAGNDNYGVYTYPGSGATEPVFETATPVTFEVPTPTVTLSQTTFPAVGETEITVTGEGFDPEAGVGTRPPLAGQPAGAYVVFGNFADVWKPSEGAPSSARANSSQQWATPNGEFGVPIDDNGDFTTTLTIDKEAADAVAEEGNTNYGVFTYPGSGATEPAFETATPVEFVTEVVESQVSIVAADRRFGQASLVNVFVTADAPTEGTVTLRAGGEDLATSDVVNGRASFGLGELPRGVYRLGAVFSGNDAVSGASAQAIHRVRKARSSTRGFLERKPAPSQRGLVKFRIGSPTTDPEGRVRLIYKRPGQKNVKRTKALTRNDRGQFTLPRATKRGRYKVVVRFLGTGDIGASKKVITFRNR